MNSTVLPVVRIQPCILTQNTSPEFNIVVQILFLGVLFSVFLFLVQKLIFEIFSDSKNENLFCSSCINIYLMRN